MNQSILIFVDFKTRIIKFLVWKNKKTCLPLCEKAFGQYVHLNGFSPPWTNWCCNKWPLREKALPHSSQRNRLAPSPCNRRWCFRLYCWVNALLQICNRIQVFDVIKKYVQSWTWHRNRVGNTWKQNYLLLVFFKNGVLFVLRTSQF